MDALLDEDLPTFGVCPNCGLPIQHLPEGPQGFPWHDCDWVLELKHGAPGRPAESSTVDDMLAAIAAAVVSKAQDIPGRDLAAVLEGTAAVLKAKGGAEAGIEQKLLAFLRNEVDNDDGLEELFDETEKAKRGALGESGAGQLPDQPGG